MARLYLDLDIYQADLGGIWISCAAHASEITGFNATFFDKYFEGSPDSETIKSTLLAMAIAAIAVETGVTLSAETALIAGLPVPA
jgi:hypothetical protein